MGNVIRHKRSSTTTAEPLTTDLELGELAINTYDGKLFLKKNDGADAIVEIGGASGLFSEDAGFNIVGGTGAGASLTGSSIRNFLGGWNAGNSISTGDYNTFIGYNVGPNVSTGGDNTAVGSFCLTSSSTAVSNCTAVGNEALRYAQGSSNTAIGWLAGSGNALTFTGSNNTFIGAYTGVAMTTGQNNVGIGAQALDACTTGGFNVVVGNNAGTNLTTSQYNTLIGYYAGNDVSTGIGRNTLIGISSGTLITTGAYNTTIGEFAGSNIVGGSSNVCIGRYAGPTTNQSDQLFINSAAAASDTPLIHGDFSTGEVTINGSLEATGSLTNGSNVAIDGASLDSTTSLNINKTWTDATATDYFGQKINATLAGSPTNGENITGLWATGTSTQTPSSGTTAESFGVIGHARHNSATSGSAVTGVEGKCYFDAAGNLGAAYALRAESPLKGSTGVASAIYGLYIDNQGTVGATSAQGIYLEATAGATTNRGIWLRGDGAGSDLIFGNAADASIVFDGTDLVIDTVNSAHNVKIGNFEFDVDQILGAGEDDYVLTYDFTSNQISLEAAAGGSFPSGTLMLFQQTAAPTGWTKQTTHNNKALRVVSGTAGSGGATAFTTVFGASKSTSGHTLTTAQIPAHNHSASFSGSAMGTHRHSFPCETTLSDGGSPGNQAHNSYYNNSTVTRYTSYNSAGTPSGSVTVNNSTGGGGSHSHSLSLDLQYVDIIIASKDA